MQEEEVFSTSHRLGAGSPLSHILRARAATYAFVKFHYTGHFTT
jgi:hypothetical protein